MTDTSTPLDDVRADGDADGAPATSGTRFWRDPEVIGPGLFWAWNAVFLAFALFGVVPQVLPDLLDGLGRGMAAPAMLVDGALLALVPVVAVVLGGTILRRRPGALLGFFYGLEAPLLLVFAVRFFAIGQFNPATALLFWTAVVGLLAYGWSLVRAPSADDRTAVLVLRSALLTALFAACLYVAAWLSIYAIGLFGVLGEFIGEMWSDLARSVRALTVSGASTQLGLIVWGTLSFTLTGTLFVLAPIVVPILHGRAWWAAVRALGARTSPRTAYAWSAIVAAGIAAAFAAANVQPQTAVFARLASPPASAAEARLILADADRLRAGLTNAYLWPRRYLGTRGKVTHVRDLYLEAWGAQRLAAGALWAWEILARPLLYEPSGIGPDPAVDASTTGATSAADARGDAERGVQALDDAARSVDLYQAVFDVPLIEAERGSVTAAVRNDWQMERMASTLMDIDDREVRLERQDLVVTEHGDWAEVELHEVYRNETFDQQEVLYYFSLPETAAITGLWLGTSDDRAARYAFRVAPRGAAQAVYRAETVRRRDPALVEQLGPRQYRLRAFPVPPRQRRWDDDGHRALRTAAGEPMHLWMTYRALAASDPASGADAWPMPRLAEKRNVFWDARSARSVAGAPFVDADAWLPDTVPTTARPPRQAHAVTLASGQTVRIELDDALTRRSGAEAHAPSLRLAVVLDRSSSMAPVQAAVDGALASVRAAVDGPVDAYLTASPFRFDQPALTTLDALTSDERLPFGGMPSGALLEQFAALRAGRTYDAVLVLTDAGGFTPLGDAPAIADLGSPTWLVHLEGAFPPGYDDATQDALLASGGGIAGSVAEALARIEAARPRSVGFVPSAMLLDVGWRVVAEEAVPAPPDLSGESPGAANPERDDDGLRPIAARAAIALAARRLDAATTDARRTAIMDDLHAVAVEEAVVTPFSSLIVLVEERQERALDAAELAADRFARESETGADEVAPMLGMTVVPEPHEYALMLLAALALAWRYGRTWPRWRRAAAGGP